MKGEYNQRSKLRCERVNSLLFEPELGDECDDDDENVLDDVLLARNQNRVVARVL